MGACPQPRFPDSNRQPRIPRTLGFVSFYNAVLQQLFQPSALGSLLNGDGTFISYDQLLLRGKAKPLCRVRGSLKGRGPVLWGQMCTETYEQHLTLEEATMSSINLHKYGTVPGSDLCGNL